MEVNEPCKYLELRELQTARRIGNITVYGVVKACYSPKRTSGPDYMSTIQITDDSMEKGTVMTFKVFGQPQDLKMIRNIGDIVRLDRVCKKFYGRNKEDYVCSLAPIDRTFHGGCVSFFDYQKDDNTPYDTAFSSSRYNTFDDLKILPALEPSEEIERLDLLKELSHDIRNLLSKTAKLSTTFENKIAYDNMYEKTIFDVTVGEPFDLVCKILHVQEIQIHSEYEESGDTMAEILFVWDSTDSKPQKRFDELILNESKIVRDIQLVTKGQRLDIPIECLDGAPDHGTIVPVFRRKPSGDVNKRVVLEAGLMDRIVVIPSLPGPGSWVRFRNLMPTVNEYQLQCVITQYTVWTPHLEVKAFMENLKERQRLGEKCFWLFNHTDRIFSSYVTCSDDVPFSSLRDVRQCKTKEARKFRCLVRCYDTVPDLVTHKDLVTKCCWKRKRSSTGESNEMTIDFAFVLRVEDASDAIDVIVSGKQANQFLSSTPGPDTFDEDVDRQKQLLQKVSEYLADVVR